MKRKILIPAITILLVFVTGFSNTSIAKPMKISPLSIKVKIKKTIKFKVRIKNNTKRKRSFKNNIFWYVNDIPGGNNSVGTITQGNPATYTAPSITPKPATVIIKAVNLDTPSKFATAKVKIRKSKNTTVTTSTISTSSSSTTSTTFSSTTTTTTTTIITTTTKKITTTIPSSTTTTSTTTTIITTTTKKITTTIPSSTTTTSTTATIITTTTKKITTTIPSSTTTTSTTTTTTTIYTEATTTTVTTTTATTTTQSPIVSQNLIQFYTQLNQKILTYDVDDILRQHDELFIKIINHQISTDEANDTILQLIQKLETVTYSPPSHLQSWKHMKLAPQDNQAYFGSWNLRHFLLSKEYIGADPAFAQTFNSSKKFFIFYTDIPIQDPAGNLQNIDEPIQWTNIGVMPPPTLMIKAQLRMGAIPAIQFHLFDCNSETWMKESSNINIDRTKQFDATDVVDGKLDNYLEEQMNILNSIDYPIILMFVNEFNTYATNLFGTSGKDLYAYIQNNYGESALYNQYGDWLIPDGPERIRDAWKKLKSIMDNTGASSHISLASYASAGHQNPAFTAPETLSPHLENWNHLEYYWPGQDIIDFIGMSAYGYELDKNIDTRSLYGAAYFWWQEIKNSSWQYTPTFFSELAPAENSDFPGNDDSNYMPSYLQSVLSDVIPNNYPVSFVLLISPLFSMDINSEVQSLQENFINNNFYADTAKFK